MNTSRPELTPEQALIRVKKLSAKISALSDDVEIEKKQRQLKILENKFWNVVKNTSVIHTSIPPDGNNEREVTFVCRGDPKNHNEEIKLYGDFLKPLERPLLEKIPGTDIYTYSKKLANNLRTEFIFLKKDDVIDTKWEDDRHVLSMPKARPQPYVPSREEARSELQKMESDGRFVKCTIDEDGPYKGREYWVHLPPKKNQVPPYSLLLCLDGQEYHTRIPTPSMMDRMIEANAIKPTITVLLANKGSEGRFNEYNCDTAFTDFLSKKFIPKIQEQYQISKNPNDVTIAGSSAGGLAAIYAGLTHPEVFGNVISLSGALWKAGEIIHKTTTGERLQAAIDNFPSKDCKLKIEMKVGTSENDDWAPFKETGKDEKYPSMLKSNHDYADIMNEKGIQADCKEFPGGHNDACWQGLLSEGLTHKSYQEEVPQKTNIESQINDSDGYKINPRL